MHRSMRHLLTATAAAFALMPSQFAQIYQIKPLEMSSQPAGSARVIGRVVAADNGNPVRGVVIRLTGLVGGKIAPAVQITRAVETERDGRFAFSALPAGSYYLEITPATGFVRPRRQPHAKVADGQTVDITARLVRTGAIEGRVRDEHGDPVIGVQLSAMRQVRIGAHVIDAHPAGTTTTNDRGEFRLFNLPPADYSVVAFQQFSGSAVMFGPTGVKLGSPDMKPVPRSGYATTYYPASPTLIGAGVLDVRAGRDRTGVNFTLRTSPRVTVFVDALNSLGEPIDPELHVTLVAAEDPPPPDTRRHAVRVQPTRFVLEGITPGRYVLIAWTLAAAREGAYVPVTIGKDDTTLSIRTNTGARVSGRILVDGAPLSEATQPEWVKKVSISANQRRKGLDLSYARPPAARVAGDRFELEGLRGPMVLRGEMSGGALLSIERGGANIAGRPVEFAGTEVVDDVVVTFTTQTSDVTATLSAAGATREPHAVFVILFSEDPNRRHAKYAAATVSDAERIEHRTVSLTRMPPGRYRIVAIRDFGLGDPTDPRVLEQLRPYSTPVTLLPRQTTRVALSVSTLR